MCDYNGGMVEEERKLFSSGVVTHPSFLCLSLATDGNDVILILMKKAQRIQTVPYSSTLWVHNYFLIMLNIGHSDIIFWLGDFIFFCSILGM